jgi:hypothetical protein
VWCNRCKWSEQALQHHHLNVTVCSCLALLNPSQRNWYCKSQPTSLVAIYLWKLDENRRVLTCMMFIDTVDGCW